MRRFRPLRGCAAHSDANMCKLASCGCAAQRSAAQYNTSQRGTAEGLAGDLRQLYVVVVAWGGDGGAAHHGTGS